MRKSVGFRREIRAPWFDAAAAVRTETDDLTEMRERLDTLLAVDMPGAENRSLTVQILQRIWAKPDLTYRQLHQEALRLFTESQTSNDRIWLHYGMCLLTYPFFRDGMSRAGLLLRQRGVLTNVMLKQRIIAQMGQLGSLENASRSLMFVLRQWGMIVPGGKRGEYIIGQRISTDNRELQIWLTRAALCAHDADAIALGDLLNWSAIFPFELTVTSYDIRQNPMLEIERHGSNIDVIRTAS
jgi:hypothetical protein